MAASHWFENVKSKAKSKAKRLFHHVSGKPPRAPSSTLPSTSSQPVPLLPTIPSSQPTPSPLAAADEDDSSSSLLRIKLWNQAYDDLKATERKLVDEYEECLSAQLAAASEREEKKISSDYKTRCDQMQKLVQAGLERTKKQASTKERINEGLKIVQTVSAIVEEAVSAVPEAAVAWVGICFGMEILSNSLAEAGENRKGIAHVLSRMQWYWELAPLLLAKNKAKQSLDGLRNQLEEHIAQLYRKLLSYQMRSACLYRRHWAAVVARDAIKLDDWASQLREIEQEESAVERCMKQYNTEVITSHLHQIADVARSWEMNLEDINFAIRDQTRQDDKRDEENKDARCRQDLRDTDPRDDKTSIENKKGGLLKDSSSWILDTDDYQAWHESSFNQLLWIRGDPGKGKTMLLCGIIDELEKDPRKCLSYFFCEADKPRLNNATAVLRGLIYLLIERQPLLVSHVRKRYDSAGKQLFEDENALEALSKILRTMLNDPSLDGAILVVDALDECKTDRNRLLDFIIEPSRVKWVVSSRNWEDIEEKLGSKEQKVECHLELHEDTVSEAVDKYIAFKVGELASLKSYDVRLRNAVEQHLFDNASGTFLWVALVCQELENVAQRKTLSRLKQFPPGLDNLYKRMMDQISDSDDKKICKEILAIASVVYRPVTLNELWNLMESPEGHDSYDDLPQIVRSCGSFLRIQEEDDAVHFVHQSAKDFLLNKASGQILPRDVATQHHALFSTSLKILSRNLGRGICGSDVPGAFVDDVSAHHPDRLSSIRYSCVHWVDHLHDSGCTMTSIALRDDGKIQEFIEKHFLHWLECLGYSGEMSKGVTMILKLDNLLQGTETQRLAKLIQDARRFILSFKQAIEMDPLQVYSSAIIFSPEHSLIRKLFEREIDWIKLKPKVQTQWNNCLQTLEGHSAPVISVTFSSDGQYLASGSYNNDSHDGIIKIWDVATGACLQTLEGHTDFALTVAFSTDSQRLASGSHDTAIKIWDTATGICLQTLQGHDKSVLSVAFSPHQQLLVSGSGDGTIKTWDALTGGCLQTLKDHYCSVILVAFSADGHRLASVSEDGTVKVWDPRTGTCLQTLDGNGSWPKVCLSPDGKCLAIGMQDKTVKIWDTAKRAYLQSLDGHNDKIMSVAFSPDGQRLVSASADHTIKIWNPTTTTCLQTFHGHNSYIYSVAFSPTNQLFASSSYDGTIKLWDATTNTNLQIPPDHSDEIRSIAFSSNSQLVASGSHDKTIKIWDATTGACQKTLRGHDNAVTSVAFSPNNALLVSSSWDQTIKIWNTTTGACQQTLQGHDCVLSIAVSPNSQLVASGSDQTIRIWNTTTGACQQKLQAHDNAVTSVVFSPNNAHLISGSWDKTIKTWDITTGACLQLIHIETKFACFSLDGTSCSHPFTDIGILNLKIPILTSAEDGPSTQKIFLEDISRSGYGFSTDQTWITKHGKNMLWIPTEFRSPVAMVMGSKIAIGCPSRRVFMMDLS